MLPSVSMTTLGAVGFGVERGGEGGAGLLDPRFSRKNLSCGDLGDGDDGGSGTEGAGGAGLSTWSLNIWRHRRMSEASAVFRISIVPPLNQIARRLRSTGFART